MAWRLYPPHPPIGALESIRKLPAILKYMTKNSSTRNKKIRKALRPYLWDYNADPIAYYRLVKFGKRSPKAPFDIDRSIVRLLERMQWYDLIGVFGLSGMKKMITRKRIDLLRDPLLKEHYEFARQLLHKEPLSISGWRPEYRKKIKATLLSDRRYRP